MQLKSILKVSSAILFISSINFAAAEAKKNLSDDSAELAFALSKCFGELATLSKNSTYFTNAIKEVATSEPGVSVTYFTVTGYTGGAIFGPPAQVTGYLTVKRTWTAHPAAGHPGTTTYECSVELN